MLRNSSSSWMVFASLLPLLVMAQTPSPVPQRAAQASQGAAVQQSASLDPLRNTKQVVTDDWLTFGHDQQRSGWNSAETVLSTKNVSHMKILWSTQLPVTPSPHAMQTLTEPLIVSGVRTSAGVRTLAFVMGNDSTLMALDVADGTLLWQKHYDNKQEPVRGPTRTCPNAEQATPAIDKDKDIIYFTTSDGNLRGVSLEDGSEKLAPTPVVAPYSRNWSLNIVHNFVYTSAGRGCGGNNEDPIAYPIEPGHVAAADITDPMHVNVQQFYTGFGRPAGPWGRGGPVLGPQGLYVQTADGLYDPASGFWGETVLALRPGARGAADSFTPPNWRYLNAHDLDLGSGSSTIFAFKDKAFLVTGAKEGVLYLLNANALGGGAAEHNKAIYTSPKLGNDPDRLEEHGIWGGISSWETASGDRFVYVPMLGEPSKSAPMFPATTGDVSHGSIMAFKLAETSDSFALQPTWIAGVVQAPDTIAIANGIVFAVGTGEQTIQNPTPAIPDNLAWSKFRTTPAGHMILYAFDALTGKALYSSKDLLHSWVHFSQPVVSHGKVFVVSYDGNIYAFGLPK